MQIFQVWVRFSRPFVMIKCTGKECRQSPVKAKLGGTTSAIANASTSVADAKKQGKGGNNNGKISKGSLSQDQMNLIESHFKCVLCCNLLSQPVSLPCGHMFCAKCLLGYKDPSESSLRCPHCFVSHQMTSSFQSSAKGATATNTSTTTPVHAVAEFLEQLDLNGSLVHMSGYGHRNLTVCLKHQKRKDPLSTENSECGNVNWKVNFNRCQSSSNGNDDRLPFVYEMRLWTDVSEWKNGYPVESAVYMAEGLRWTLAVIPTRGDDNDERRGGNIEKPTSFSLAVFCKGWADKTCRKPLSKPVKLSVWITINHANDCSFSYNSGARLCKFDHLDDARKRSAVVVSKVMQVSKLRSYTEGWLQLNDSLSLVCKFKVPKKMVKLNVQLPRPTAALTSSSSTSS